MSTASPFRIGVLSDTHGLLRPEARAFMLGCDYIIHGGDIGSHDLLEELSAIAPLIAVRGNNDTQAWAKHLRETELVRLSSAFVYVIHDLSKLDITPRASGVTVIISGHSHKPLIETRDEVLFLNPGSCGPQRFKLPISIGEILIENGALKARTVELV